jgi:hypothetical protein
MGFSAPEKMVLQSIVTSSAGLCATRAKESPWCEEKGIVAILASSLYMRCEFLIITVILRHFSAFC